MYGNPTRNQDHPQNKHNEDNRNMIGLSPGELQWGKWRQLKRRNQAKAKNMPLSKQCLYMMTKPQKNSGNRKNTARGITTSYLWFSAVPIAPSSSPGPAEIRGMPLSLRLFGCNPRCSFFVVSCSSREAAQGEASRF